MNILFLTINRFSDGSAGSQREIVLGKLLRTLGYSIFFCTLADTKYGEVDVFDGFEYISFRKYGKSPIKRALNYINYKRNLKHLLLKRFSTQKIEQIFVTNIPWNALKYVTKYANNKGTGLVHNSVEWYSPEEFRYGKFSINYISNYLLNTIIIRPPFNVIGISSYLSEHFQSRGLKSIRIPFIIDKEAIKCNKKCSFEKIVLLYAGNPGRKDYLKEMIEGLATLSNYELERIEFRIFGVNYNSLINDCKVDKLVYEKLKKNLKLYGSVSHNVVLSHLQEAHFTLLLRSDKLRYAKAGFPTKVTESLACGTPVISNLTSDLGMYIQDGIEGFIVPSCTTQAFAQSIRRALLLTPDEIVLMQVAARKCAENKLDYRNFLEVMKSFLVK